MTANRRRARRRLRARAPAAHRPARRRARAGAGHGPRRRFGVSAVTIRKDLLVLESEGRVIRAHGGAIAPGSSRPERAFDVRERLQRAEKARIGAAAAALVVDGESIALDASTTALYRRATSQGPRGLAPAHRHHQRPPDRLRAGRAPGDHRAMPGGWVRWEALSVVGPLGDGVFRRVNIQKAFMGAAGFTIETGSRDATEEEAQIKRSMVGAAREVVRDRRPHEVGPGRLRHVLPDGPPGWRVHRRRGADRRWSARCGRWRIDRAGRRSRRRAPSAPGRRGAAVDDPE